MGEQEFPVEVPEPAEPIAASETPLTEPTPPHGYKLRAGFGYLAILILLFHRLLGGGILHPGAIVNYGPPFNAGNPNAQQYLNLIQTDVWQQFTIFEREQHERAKHGEFPQWNPNIYGGMPLHADAQTAFLNPFHWVYFITDPNYTRGPMAAARLWVSAFALYVLLRRHGVDGIPAFIGGVVWMLASFNIRWLHWPHTNSSLWLPVLLLAIDAWIDRPSVRRFGLLGLAATVWMLAGHPGTMLWVGYVAVGFAVVRAGMEPIAWGAKFVRLSGVAAGMLIGITGAAAALLPFVHEMLRSQEWAEHTRGVMDTISFSQTLALYFAPEHYGWDRAALTSYSGPANYNEACCWFGLMALAVAAAVVVFVFVPRERPWNDTGIGMAIPVVGVVLFVLCGLAAMGVSPFHQLVEWLPGAAVTQARRLFFGAQLGGALLAAIGLHVLLRGGRPRFNLVVGGLVGVSVFVMAMLFFASKPNPVQGQPEIPSDLTMVKAAWSKLPGELVWKHSAVRSLVQLVLALGCGATVITIIVLAWLGRAISLPWKMALVVVITAEMFWSAWDQNVVAPAEIADPVAPRSVSDIARATEEKFSHARVIAAWNLLPANLCMRYGYRDVRGYDLPMAQRVSAAMKEGGVTMFEQIVHQAGRGVMPQQVYPELSAKLGTFLDKMGTKYVMTCVQYIRSEPTKVLPVGSVGGADKPWTLMGVGPTGEVVYDNPNAYPRAYVAKRAVRGSEHEAMAALSSPYRNLMDSSVVEDPADPKGPEIPGSEHVTLVNVVKDFNERVEIEVESDKGGLVVLGDNMAPGWSVEVDGAKATALTANYLFRGVVVPGGFHRVKWTYAAPGLRSGAVVSLVAVGLMLGATMVGKRKSAFRVVGTIQN